MRLSCAPLAAMFLSVLSFNCGMLPARADSPIRQAALGFCSLSSMSAATAITTCSNWAAVKYANYAVICAYVQGAVYRDDGVAPTSTPGIGGQGISTGACLSYSGPIPTLQFIQQTSGAILGISFYQ